MVYQFIFESEFFAADLTFELLSAGVDGHMAFEVSAGAATLATDRTVHGIFAFVSTDVRFQIGLAA